MWSVLKNYTDAALLFLRITLGSFFIYVHGWPMLAGGLTKWRAIGGAMRHIGINMAPGFWGFMAASAETLGCLFFVIGFCFRPSALMLFVTMTVAAIADFDSARGNIHSSFGEAAHALE